MSRIKASQIALFSVLLIAVFLLGFWGGQVSVLEVNDEHVLLRPHISLEEYANNQRLTQWPETSSVKNAIVSVEGSTGESLDEISNETVNDVGSIFEALSKDPNANDLLSFLIDIASSENADDMQYFAGTMDKLRNLVKEDPAAIQALIDRFLLADADAKSPYYVISILQGADIPNRDELFENLAQQLLNNNSDNAQVKFLHLVSSTGMQENNQTISNMLADIALYSNMETSNRLYALDLLMPYQLEAGQKQNIVNDLKLNINNMEESQKSYAIENMMRFSEPSSRQQMAREFLSATNDLSTRVAILTSLHSGTLKPSVNLKDQLFNIANNTQDPLSNHAKHALMHVFDINKSEYDQLNR